MNKQIKKNKKGFTLVEMIVVIAIIGVLAAMMVPSLLGYIDKAHTSNNRSAAATIGRAAAGVMAEGTVLTASAISNDNSVFSKAVNASLEGGNVKGSYKITVTSNNIKVIYDKTGAVDKFDTAPTSESNKDFGIYPEV